MDELIGIVKSFIDSGWSIVSVVAAFSYAIVWTIKYIKTREARSEIENREYVVDAIGFSESKIAMAEEQFEILSHEVTSLFFKYSEELRSSYKRVNKNENENQILISRKSDTEKHESISSFKRTFYDETMKAFNKVARSSVAYYKEYAIDENIGDFLDEKGNDNAKRYIETLEDRAMVCTSSIISRMQIDTWNHEIIDRCVSEVISYNKVKDALHALYRNYHSKELTIKRRADERKTKPLLKA
jgi:hypothetical protein